MTAGEQEPVCIAFPTIQSGLVLRWYADETQDVELADAGREEARVLVTWCSERVRDQAVAAHKSIREAYRRSLHPRVDVSAWVTHERVRFLSDEIRAFPPAAVSGSGEPTGSTE